MNTTQTISKEEQDYLETPWNETWRRLQPGEALKDDDLGSGERFRKSGSVDVGTFFGLVGRVVQADDYGFYYRKEQNGI